MAWSGSLRKNPMCHSWERITLPFPRVPHGKELPSFAPWVTHGVELRVLIVRKMPRSMHNMRPCIGKELHYLPQKDIPVN